MDVGLFDSVFCHSSKAAVVHTTLHLWVNGQVDMSERPMWNRLAQCSVGVARDQWSSQFIQNCTAFCAVSATYTYLPTWTYAYNTGAWSLFWSNRTDIMCGVRHSKTYQKWTWRSSDPILICLVLSIHTITVTALKLRYVIVIFLFPFYFLRYSQLRPNGLRSRRYM